MSETEENYDKEGMKRKENRRIRRQGRNERKRNRRKLRQNAAKRKEIEENDKGE
jgi:hypothetical protein